MGAQRNEPSTATSQSALVRWMAATGIGAATFLGLSFLTFAFITLGGSVREGAVWAIGGVSIAIALLVAGGMNATSTRPKSPAPPRRDPPRAHSGAGRPPSATPRYFQIDLGDPSSDRGSLEPRS